VKHLELLNLLCRHRRVIDEAYKDPHRRVEMVPPQLLEVGLFLKIGEYYYLNELYINFIDTLLARADLSYIATDFEKELNRLNQLKEEYQFRRRPFTQRLIFQLLNQIYQGMKNRDRRLGGLIENLERDQFSDLEFLLKEARKILEGIGEVMERDREIVAIFEEFMDFPEFREFIKDIFLDLLHLNRNIDGYLKRLREFISQTEKKRRFNRKLFKTAQMILNEDSRVEEFLTKKMFRIQKKMEYVPDIAYINYNRVKRIVGSLTRPRKVKKTTVKRELEEVISLIDLKTLLTKVQGSSDIFKSVVEHIGKIDRELLNESVRVFVYLLNHYDKELIYTPHYNEFNVRIVQWKV